MGDNFKIGEGRRFPRLFDLCNELQTRDTSRLRPQSTDHKTI